MPVMETLGIMSAVASGVSSIFNGQAQSAAARAQNEQAYRNWLQSNTQKTFNNAREQFLAAQAFEQQLKKNSAIRRAAWEYQFDAQRALSNNIDFQQSQLSKQIQSQQSALLGSVLGKNISGSSGLLNALAISQTLNALEAAKNLEYNALQEKKNIDRQTSNMLTQQTENVFMPNIQLPDEAPIFGDTSSSAMGGLISGALQIGGAVGAAVIK